MISIIKNVLKKPIENQTIMSFNLRNFSELYSVATPVTGAFKEYIGTAKVNDIYTVKVMIKDGNLDITNKKVTHTYIFKQGYIMLKPLID
jgi:hypothetical protein